MKIQASLPISYRTDSYNVSYVFVYRIVLILISYRFWGNWPMSSTFFVVQFNSILLLGQDSVQNVQWSMTWAKSLPSLSCLSTLVVATPSELFLSSLFFWRQLSIERCSNLKGSLWPPILQLNTIGFRLDWLILTMLGHAELLTILQCTCSGLQCWLRHTVKFLLTLNQLIY